jgi:hypothetical protein
MKMTNARDKQDPAGAAISLRPQQQLPLLLSTVAVWLYLYAFAVLCGSFGRWPCSSGL